MYFNDFLPYFSTNFADMISTGKLLYTVDADGTTLWNTYLESFPAGAERQSHNCNSCRSFIKNFGHLVIIDDQYNLRSIWDFVVDDPMWQGIVNNLRDMLILKRDILAYVIAWKIEQKDASRTAAIESAEERELRELINEKEKEAKKGKSLEELKAEYNAKFAGK